MYKMTFEEFTEYYNNKGYLPYGVSCSRINKLNNKELKTKYKTYEKKIDISEKDYKVSYQDEWLICRNRVYARDYNICQLWKVLTQEEKKIARNNGYFTGWPSRLTPAHFVSRSRDSSLICEADNVYTLSLLFHGRLDEGKNPITGEFIGQDRILTEWWSKIVPKEAFNKYKNIY